MSKYSVFDLYALRNLENFLTLIFPSDKYSKFNSEKFSEEINPRHYYIHVDLKKLCKNYEIPHRVSYLFNNIIGQFSKNTNLWWRWGSWFPQLSSNLSSSWRPSPSWDQCQCWLVCRWWRPSAWDRWSCRDRRTGCRGGRRTPVIPWSSPAGSHSSWTPGNTGGRGHWRGWSGSWRKALWRLAI